AAAGWGRWRACPRARSRWGRGRSPARVRRPPTTSGSRRSSWARTARSTSKSRGRRRGAEQHVADQLGPLLGLAVLRGGEAEHAPAEPGRFVELLAVLPVAGIGRVALALDLDGHQLGREREVERPPAGRVKPILRRQIPAGGGGLL